MSKNIASDVRNHAAGVPKNVGKCQRTRFKVYSPWRGRERGQAFTVCVFGLFGRFEDVGADQVGVDGSLSRIDLRRIGRRFGDNSEGLA